MTVSPGPSSFARRLRTRGGHRLFNVLKNIDDPRTPCILKIYKMEQQLFHLCPGSGGNHQAWPGGYADHLADMLELSGLEYRLLNSYAAKRGGKLPFTLASAQVVIFCHDAEKLCRHAPENHQSMGLYADIQRTQKCTWSHIRDVHILPAWDKACGLALTDEEKHAIRYIHGEGDDYRKDKRVMSELAAFCGNLDRTSARIFHSLTPPK